MPAAKKNALKEAKETIVSKDKHISALQEQLVQQAMRLSDVQEDYEEVERKNFHLQCKNDHLEKVAKNLDEQLSTAHEMLSGLGVPTHLDQTNQSSTKMSLLQRLTVFLQKK